MLKFLNLFILFSIPAIAQDWVVITPLPECPEVKIEFQEKNYQYFVRYRLGPQQEYVALERPIENVNDLSTLTDEIVELSYLSCPSNHLSAGTGEICDIDYNSSQPFSDDYAQFLKSLILEIDRKGNNCQDVIPYIALQQSVEQLSEQDLISFDRSGHVFKLFTGSNIDSMIDHFRECGGGEQGTRQFIENLILLEAKNACIFPAPPGMVSFEKSKEIAKEVAQKYPSMGLWGLNKNRNNITKDTIEAFIPAIFETQIKSLVGEDEELNSKLMQIPSVQTLKNLKSKYALDYTMHVLATDGPLEVVDLILPKLVTSSFEEMFQHMPQDQREVFFQEKLVDPINKQYQHCISPHKQRLKFHEPNLSTKDLINHRKQLKQQFCEVNPAECEKTGCEGHSNFTTLRTDITDFSLIQSCLFQAINMNLNDVIASAINVQAKALEGVLELTSNSERLLAEYGTESLNLCTDQKAQEVTNKSIVEKTPNHPEAYLHLTAKQYSNIMLDCAKIAERKITEEIAKLTLASNPAYQEFFKGEGTHTAFDLRVPEGAYIQATQIVDVIIDRCYRQQRKSKTLQQTTSSVCLPMIEMEAGAQIVTANLDHLLHQNDADEEQARVIIDNYFNCSEQALTNAFAAINNEAHPHAIIDESSAASYLNINPEFLNCTKKSIMATVENLTSLQLDQVIADAGKDFSNPKFFTVLRPEIEALLNQCFQSAIDNIPSWEKFINFSSDEGIGNLEKDCKQKAEDFAIPRVIESELAMQLDPMNETNAINLSLEEFVRLLNPGQPDTRNSREILLDMYQTYRKSRPDSNIKEFTDQFVSKAQSQIMKTLHGHIIQQTVEDFPVEFDYSDFSSVLSPHCLDDMFTLHQDNIRLLIDEFDKKPASEEKVDLQALFVEILQGGLVKAREQNRFDEFIAKLKNICENPRQFADLKSLVELQVADDFIVSLLQDKVREAFLQTAEDQCREDIELFNIDLPQSLSDKLCAQKNMTYLDLEHLKYQIEKLIDNPDQKQIIDFIVQRKRNTVKLAQNALSSEVIENLFIKDREVLDFIYQNFVGAVTQDSVVSAQVNQMVVGKLFKDRSLDSFASRFIELQLSTSIGVQGYAEAKNKLVEKMDERRFFKKTLKKRALNSLKKRWTYNGIKGYLNWDNLSQNKRNELMEVVIETSILPAFDPNNSEEQLQRLKDKGNEAIMEHIDNHASIPNPHFRAARKKPHFTKTGRMYFVEYPEKGPRYLNFSEALTEDITQDIKNSFWWSF